MRTSFLFVLPFMLIMIVFERFQLQQIKVHLLRVNMTNDGKLHIFSADLIITQALKGFSGRIKSQAFSLSFSITNGWVCGCSSGFAGAAEIRFTHATARTGIGTRPPTSFLTGALGTKWISGQDLTLKRGKRSLFIVDCSLGLKTFLL